MDLETTGFSRSKCNIIEIAAEILGPDGIPLEDGTYAALIRPPCPVPPIVVKLTGITNDMLKDKPMFLDVIAEFFKFVSEKVGSYEEEVKDVHHIIVVGHNAKRFDIPFWLRK